MENGCITLMKTAKPPLEACSKVKSLIIQKSQIVDIYQIVEDKADLKLDVPKRGKITFQFEALNLFLIMCNHLSSSKC